jgi:hypothetical protein
MEYSKYKIAICHLYHPFLHGYTEESSSNIVEHFLVYHIVNVREFYGSTFQSEIEDVSHFYNNIELNQFPHPTIRNYQNIIEGNNYIKLDIILSETLSGFEEVAYIKTFWIKIFQRKWKNIYYKRKQFISKIISNPKYLLKREITGKMIKI